MVQSYRQALDLLWDDKKNYQVKKGEFIERLRAVETRGFTHGFFKKKQEDISNYRERTGLGNRQYVGKVLGRVGEMVEILAKNQIRLSDSLDVLSPKIIRKITINRFMDKKGNDLGEVVNTNDIFYFVTDLDLRPGDLLRKIITK